MRTAPEVYPTRAVADKALWAMAANGRADVSYDSRYRALVLLAAFASLRWGEATALRRCDVDLEAGTVRIRAAFAERSTGQIVLGPPKSRAGRRIVGIPRAIIPALREHLSVFVATDPGALVFPGPKGVPLRRGNFNRQASWPHAVRAIGAEGLHFHDLRHTGTHGRPERRGPQRRDGADGPRQRARRDHLPARGTRRRCGHHRSDRRSCGV
jgi:integrase